MAPTISCCQLGCLAARQGKSAFSCSKPRLRDPTESGQHGDNPQPINVVSSFLHDFALLELYPIPESTSLRFCIDKLPPLTTSTTFLFFNLSFICKDAAKGAAAASSSKL